MLFILFSYLTVKSNFILHTSVLQGHTVYVMGPAAKLVEVSCTIYDWFNDVVEPLASVTVQHT